MEREASRRVERRASRIAHRASRIAHRASRIAHRASRIAHRASRIAHRASTSPPAARVATQHHAKRPDATRLSRHRRPGARRAPYDRLSARKVDDTCL
ncbi:hypothetical protein GNZ24_27145 [Burkholderia thailandensis]|nr:hypothetical protein A8H31_11710 [Burkholderia thailandensis]MUV30602.1 hypothetical protein [Burkholderia thailandensis]